MLRPLVPASGSQFINCRCGLAQSHDILLVLHRLDLAWSLTRHGDKNLVEWSKCWWKEIRMKSAGWSIWWRRSTCLHAFLTLSLSFYFLWGEACYLPQMANLQLLKGGNFDQHKKNWGVLLFRQTCVEICWWFPGAKVASQAELSVLKLHRGFERVNVVSQISPLCTVCSPPYCEAKQPSAGP